MTEAFISVGDQVCCIGSSKYRYQFWPRGVWLEAGVKGRVTEYHPKQPSIMVQDECPENCYVIEGIDAWAVVTWDFGGQTAIDATTEGDNWERVSKGR